MTTPDDPRRDAPLDLDALARAYADLPVPEATPSLAAADDATRDVVAALRAAYQGLPVPAARPPAVRRPAAPSPLLTLVRHAVAAAVVLGLGLAIQRGGPELVPGQRPPPPAPEAPRLVAAADDHIELRSGSVRLVLVTATPTLPETD